MTRLFAGTPFDQPPTCERCGQLEAECGCPPEEAPKVYAEPGTQTARVAVEKRKKGKVVTVVRGLPAEQNDLASVLAQAKSKCGAGGTVKGDTLEVQGDHSERIRALLVEIGFRVK